MSAARFKQVADAAKIDRTVAALTKRGFAATVVRSEEHTSELQSH